jgi:hypothetical protein
MRRLIYQVAVGEVPAFYGICIESVARYCNRHHIDHIVQTEPLLRIAPLASKRSENALRLGYLPIYEKENAFAWFDRYAEIAVIDADIFIQETAPDIFDELQGATFAGVIERDMPLTPAYFDKIRKHSEGQFRNLADVDWQWNQNGAAFYNMGVMLLDRSLLDYLDGQSPAEFLRRPEFERFINGEGHWKWSTDQTLLNWWVKKTGMATRNLDWKWNALYGAVQDVTEAYFVHFFLSSKLKPGEIERQIERLCHHA